MEIRVENRRIDEEKMMRKRKEWLADWPTGKEVDFDDAIAYQKSLPDSKVWWKVIRKLAAEGRTVANPRGGTARFVPGRGISFAETSGGRSSSSPISSSKSGSVSPTSVTVPGSSKGSFVPFFLSFTMQLSRDPVRSLKADT